MLAKIAEKNKEETWSELPPLRFGSHLVKIV